MAVAYIFDTPKAKVLKPNNRKKTYLCYCSSCYGEFYFCGTGCSYNYCPICGRPVERMVADGN